ncbi:hypothetical protein D3C77_506170 [compost metagenome]
MQELDNSDELLVELEFEEKLRTLMAEYQQNLGNIINLLDPDRSKRSNPSQPQVKTRRERMVSVYTNPHNGVSVETKGGNHKQLREWKAEYGAGVVESWRKPAQA